MLVHSTDQFRQDVARLAQHAADREAVRRALAALAADGPLPPGYEDRVVQSGYARGLRLCRVPGFGDVLYARADGALVLVRFFVPLSFHIRLLLRAIRPAPRPSWRAPWLFPIMFKNYVRVALRAMRKQALYTFINIFGLAVGLACCILMVLYVQDEFAFDRFHTHADDTYRLVETHTNERGSSQGASVMGPLGPTLVETFPEVTHSARVMGRSMLGRAAFTYGANNFYEGDHLATESSFFEVFDFELLQGDPATALEAPSSVVLTETAVRRYFGDADPMGQTLATDRYGDVTVTGVLQDPPANSHLQFSMLLSFETMRQQSDGWRRWVDERWDSAGLITYVRLRPGTDPAKLAAKLPAFDAEHRAADAWQTRSYDLQPLTDIHFGSAEFFFDRNAGKRTRAHVYLFATIALLVLLIACINYMNLATARSLKRAKEVGLRKVVGAHRLQLMGQFLGESLLTTLLALGAALLLVWGLLPAFNAFTEKALTLGLIENGGLILALLALVLLVGGVGGSYPAWHLSRFRPAQVLKGSLLTAPGGARLRQGLVVVQFALSIGLIVATLVVQRQLDYVQTKDLGFASEQLITVDINSGNTRRNFQTMKDLFAAVPGVQQVSVSSRVPGEWKNIPQIGVLTEGMVAEEPPRMLYFGVDADFVPTYEITLKHGRNFSEDMASDSTAFLLNETAAQALGIAEARGQIVRVPNLDRGNNPEALDFEGRVIGIVEDFHFTSLHEDIGPLVLGFRNNPIHAIDYFTLRIETDRYAEMLAGLDAVHRQFDDSSPIEVNVLDTQWARYYQEEARTGRLFGIAAGLAILIACLGLFGLAAFMAEQRTKELGVRKVLGATEGSLVLLLSKDFAKLLGIAFVLAAPLAYLIMDRWLSSFAYHVSPGVLAFVIALLLATLVAGLTISYHALKAARANPVQALRYE